MSTSSISDSEERCLRLATVALLVEMMNADDAVDAEEMKTLHRLFRERYLLNDSEASELIELAGQKADEAIDLFQFTRLINQHYSQVQKIRLIEELWRLAIADEYVDRYEEHFVRKNRQIDLCSTRGLHRCEATGSSTGKPMILDSTITLKAKRPID